ncbi:hypothetical protein BpHYR1_022894 [Brachionus plicatilis]|uniref:Uncharacterized protein n=1 Tax=Brachionus plicatilis TaxID=10195 RepID=A0A3M7R556_BRAPC|nr:hypothetical protein BpHYR1_022894 [Brachionus plicatilis]
MNCHEKKLQCTYLLFMASLLVPRFSIQMVLGLMKKTLIQIHFECFKVLEKIVMEIYFSNFSGPFVVIDIFLVNSIRIKNISRSFLSVYFEHANNE